MPVDAVGHRRQQREGVAHCPMAREPLAPFVVRDARPRRNAADREYQRAEPALRYPEVSGIDDPGADPISPLLQLDNDAASLFGLQKRRYVLDDDCGGVDLVAEPHHLKHKRVADITRSRTVES
jgi:hypothetical protein